MDKEQFQKLVDYVTSPDAYFTYPKVLFSEGFESWTNRTSLAQALRRNRIQDLNPVLELYHSVVNEPVADPIDINTKIMVYWDLSSCIWKAEQDGDKAIHYLDLAIELAESIETHVLTLAKGQLWFNRWQLLSFSNRAKQAIMEADQKIAEHQPGLPGNSYLHYAYLFKAEILKETDIDTALEFLYKALQYFPDEHNNLDRLEELWMNRESDKEKTFTEIEKLTHFTVCWDIPDSFWSSI